jgi:hypothetical protein
MAETDTERDRASARQVSLMRTDVARAFDDAVASLHSATRGGGRLAESACNGLERKINMAVSRSEDIRDSVFSEETLYKARSQPLNGRLRRDGHRFVDLVADVGGVTVHTIIRAADGFFARPRFTSEEEEREAARADAVAAFGASG